MIILQFPHCWLLIRWRHRKSACFSKIFRCWSTLEFKKAFKDLHRGRFELGTSNILPSDSSGFDLSSHLDDFWMQSGCETYSNVFLEVYSTNMSEVNFFSDFHVPFYGNKRLYKTNQCRGYETDPRYPTRQVALFRAAITVVHSW